MLQRRMQDACKEAVHARGRVRTAVEPRKEVLGAVVGVKDDGDAVLLGHRAHVERARHRTRDRRLVVGIVETLASVKLRAARRELDDDGRIHLTGGLEARVDGGGGDCASRGEPQK